MLSVRQIAVRKQMWSKINVICSDSGELLLYLLPLAVTDTITFARQDLQGIAEWNVLVNTCTTHEIESNVNVRPRAGVDGMEKAINDWASELNFIEVQCKCFWKEYFQSDTKLFCSLWKNLTRDNTRRWGWGRPQPTCRCSTGPTSKFCSRPQFLHQLNSILL